MVLMKFLKNRKKTLHLKFMKILMIIWLLLLSCQKKDESTTPDATAGKVPTEYFAEYGIPDQSLIQACSGEKELVRPITKCIRKSTNLQVNVSLCYTLKPVLMSLPSPAGTRQVLINGGQRLETCEEGSQNITSINYLCNPGFLLINNKCQSYETVGSYSIQKDQIYKKENGYQLLLTIGNDHSVKVKDNYKLIMLME